MRLAWSKAPSFFFLQWFSKIGFLETHFVQCTAIWTTSMGKEPGGDQVPS